VISFLLLLLLLIIVLIAAIVLLVLARSGLHDHPSCGKCGCDVSEAIGVSAQCPGCGLPFAEVGIIAPGRMRRPALLGMGLGLLIVSLAGLVGVMMLTPGTATEMGATQAEAVKEHLQMLEARGEAEAAQAALEEAMREDETEADADLPEAAATEPEETQPAATDNSREDRNKGSPDKAKAGDDSS